MHEPYRARTYDEYRILRSNNEFFLAIDAARKGFYQRGLFEGKRLWYWDYITIADGLGTYGYVLGVASIPFIPESLFSSAKICAAPSAQVAAAARSCREEHHSLTATKRAHTFAYLLNNPCDLVTDNARWCDPMMAMIENAHVCPTHPASLNANEKSALRAVGSGYLFDGHLQRAFEHRCHHLVGSFHLFNSSRTLQLHRTPPYHTISKAACKFLGRIS